MTTKPEYTFNPMTISANVRPFSSHPLSLIAPANPNQ